MRYTYCPVKPPAPCYPPQAEYRPSCPPPYAPPCPPEGPRPKCPPQGDKRPCAGRPFLLPRVVAWGREWQRRCQLCLRVEGLPESMEPPFTLLAVCAEEPERQELLPPPAPSRQLAHLLLPLCCQVRDRTGCVASGRAYIEVDVCMHLCAPAAECWRASLLTQPWVRLACLPCASDTPVFDACLEVLAEAYLVRWEMAGPPEKPACPRQELPLYPQLRMD